jgi:hypothetical protein
MTPFPLIVAAGSIVPGSTLRRQAAEINSFQRLLRNGEPNQLFDTFQHPPLFRIAQRYGNPCRPGTTGSSDPMDVGFFFSRHVVIEHVRDLIHVDTS